LVLASYYSQAGLDYKAEQQYEKAFGILESVKDDEPMGSRATAFAEAVRAKAFFLANSGRKEEALALLDDAVKEHSDNYMLIGEAMSVARRHGFDDRIDVYMRRYRIVSSQSFIDLRNRLIPIEFNRNAKFADRLLALEDSLARVIQQSDLSPELTELLTSCSKPRRWFLMGPFSQKDVGDAQRELLGAKDLETGINATQERWDISLIEHKTVSLGTNDLRGAFPNASRNVACFALAMVESPQAMEVVGRLGSDDGAEVWINGQSVHEFPFARAFVQRQDTFSVKLNKGKNLILVRIDQVGNRWSFGLELEDKEEWPAAIDWK